MKVVTPCRVERAGLGRLGGVLSGPAFKRGYHGTYHHFSPKHLARYINEFAGRHNVRDRDTLHQMALLAAAYPG